ncbi:uncharacterized protein STEHIDRAFT_147100 [Stereum hirsutum FP-91666 SS1]|uniref:uncharacterized protein n=1 Tax=Stereum hirsutum (strain FP-91666) TaxID=721885 RepID=UPI000440E5A1|nr:uncharacterized protein STEHIDRAFT_147100 [Stereum hirsutum FP-91666 SS1]EIM86525.1 hypothetical protein STEHIDRAFT_147100 [Stereum hirsutum FP-91666 SS1]
MSVMQTGSNTLLTSSLGPGSAHASMSCRSKWLSVMARPRDLAFVINDKLWSVLPLWCGRESWGKLRDGDA